MPHIIVIDENFVEIFRDGFCFALLGAYILLRVIARWNEKKPENRRLL
ncbi:MAG: hypothetical protein WCS86_00540 [Candidatus Paceibacterota bacterium]